MSHGTVKWFNSGKGFVAPDDSSKDVFVHFSATTRDRYTRLDDSQRVEFDTTQAATSPQADNVHRA